MSQDKAVNYFPLFARLQLEGLEHFWLSRSVSSFFTCRYLFSKFSLIMLVGILILLFYVLDQTGTASCPVQLRLHDIM